MKKIAVAILAVLLFAFGIGNTNLGNMFVKIGRALQTQDAIADKGAVTDNVKDLFVELSKRLVPSVVNIYTTQTVANPYGAGNPQAELYKKFFENFFGEDFVPNMPQSRKATSLGTGFIIDEKEGLILTNYHVIADADEIKIILTEQEADQEGIDAKVVGGDAEADVAVLKIKSKRNLKAAPLGDSEALQVGEWVMAVGNPFGHGHTVTHGIISAKERIVPISQFSNYLQTDAPINPGNSGGPLINSAGQVIGINTAINAAAQGIGFAIPINFVKKILPELRTKGAVTRGFIGVNIAEITPPLAKHLKLKENIRGVVVSEVFEEEPAAKAGIQPYDVITEINGKKVSDGRQLVAAISTYAPGAKISVKVLRKGKEKSLEVVVGKRPSRDSMLSRRNEEKGSGAGKPTMNIGMGVEDLDSEARRELGIPANIKGVVVAKVAPNSPAEEAGFRRGDVIVEVDEKATPDVDSFYSVFNADRVYVIRVRRGDGFTITTLDLSGEDQSRSKGKK